MEGAVVIEITVNRIMSGCHGKFAFDSMTAALASFCKKKDKHGIEAYHCEVCKKYHVGSTKLSRGRKLQRQYLNEKRVKP